MPSFFPIQANANLMLFKKKKSSANDSKSRVSFLKALWCINAMTPDDTIFSSVVEALLDPEEGREMPFLVIPTVS